MTEIESISRTIPWCPETLECSEVILNSFHEFGWGILTRLCLSAAIMSSVLQKLISPLAGSPSEPPRNKVTVVGVGQVGMACAISTLLRVRHNGD